MAATQPSQHAFFTPDPSAIQRPTRPCVQALFPLDYSGTLSAKNPIHSRNSWSEAEIETASIAAIDFVKAYYQSMDKPLERLELLGQLYRPNSSVVWNGTKASTLPDIGTLLARLPPSRTDLVDFNSHPIGGSSPPRILVHVQGHVRHTSPSQLISQGSASAGSFTSRLVALHTPLAPNPDPSAVADPAKPNWVPVADIPQPPHAVGPPEVPDFDMEAHRRSSKKEGANSDPSKIETAPRWFSQTFLLAADNENSGAVEVVQPKVCPVPYARV